MSCIIQQLHYTAMAAWRSGIPSLVRDSKLVGDPVIERLGRILLQYFMYALETECVAGSCVVQLVARRDSVRTGGHVVFVSTYIWSSLHVHSQHVVGFWRSVMGNFLLPCTICEGEQGA
jgi:hypothetical protein